MIPSLTPDPLLQTTRPGFNASATCPHEQARCGINFQSGQVPIACLYGVVFLLGLATNALTLWPIVLQVQHQKNVLGIYLFNLAICDLLYILTLPLWIIYVLNGHVWTLGGPVCYLVAFIFYSNMYISVLLLCCISLDRYLAVVYPIRSLFLRSRRTAGLVSGLVTLLVFTFHLGVSVRAGKQENATCYDRYPLQGSVAAFNYFRFTAGFLLPLLVLTFSYLRIFQGVNQSRTLSIQKKVKVKRLSFAIIGIFLLCFAPYHLLLLARTAVFSHTGPCSSCAFEQKVHVVFSVSLAVSSLNSALDPVLYMLVSDSMKKDVRRAFGCQRAGSQNSVAQAQISMPGLRAVSLQLS
ncbi:probable G-protein coupled receptor 132 [Rhinatrema bivittatum]|uniref:probable G-protein coupled receptor 132 n=1 Tax=Rhinatrema bivittatum TaxID=194408 RepID=UPI00112BBA05|nr:probable G-protein coupled receptor 132 [Rhinatrema bivittatum]XP_029475576.1 probable G-protein coupled receptor 132 [Rhinatrema bivittatum]XP_029475577.1 probable G-protein coupled receptor 132 [Rhinatrema bivittatum]XP_029475578.1 probable G-protein coupled receptor 132 [Rhinatrema bivittatum]XP_029475579.1 probable G-protein coupled receptor 132 [Rhinatrema bivittatum]XP_029475580.1 probable G-protein coupled receptor 132 [Rhinatrema bivittatum]XP_029475582.1 probable G-protein coupled